MRGMLERRWTERRERGLSPRRAIGLDPQYLDAAQMRERHDVWCSGPCARASRKQGQCLVRGAGFPKAHACAARALGG